MIGRFIKKYRKYIPSTLTGKIALTVIIFWIATAILSPFLANNKPIIAKGSNGWQMPIFSNQNVKADTEFSFKINPIIPYKFNDLDLNNTFRPPLSKGKKGIHLLGTDQLGRDITAGMINGARVAFIVAILATSFSSIFGIFVGLIIGFYADSGIRRNILQSVFIVSIFIFFIYYLIHLAKDGITFYSLFPVLILGIIGYFVNIFLGKIPIKKYGFPLDIMVQRLFEINEGVPGLFIILAFLAILTKSTLFSVSMIMAILIWMNFARHARAETLQIREEEYIQSAKASGLGDWRLLVRHILPNALPSLLVVMAFSFSGFILMEATLSFLGLGLPLEEVSWGKILAEARRYPKAWWLAIFPGLAIFLVLYSFNTLGDILANYQRK